MPEEQKIEYICDAMDKSRTRSSHEESAERQNQALREQHAEQVNKDAKIPEDDWKKTWKPGTYDYLDPEYKPGTHEIERGDVTWHQLRTTGNAEDTGEDITGQDPTLREEQNNQRT